MVEERDWERFTNGLAALADVGLVTLYKMQSRRGIVHSFTGIGASISGSKQNSRFHEPEESNAQ